MSSITILDYGTSNLLNVARAATHIGYDVKLIKTAEEIRNSERLILPGVGAFSDAMMSLSDKGLDEALIDYATNKQRPLLGICLGMQLLLDASYEFGHFKGLGLIKGEVVKIPELKEDGTKRRIPHVGWSPLIVNQEAGCSVIDSGSEGHCMYFVHSFMAVPLDNKVVSSTTNYEGQIINASLKLGNIVAAQFHPERSAKSGLDILKNFSKI